MNALNELRVLRLRLALKRANEGRTKDGDGAVCTVLPSDLAWALDWIEAAHRVAVDVEVVT